jgi:hypothetical protein
VSTRAVGFDLGGTLADYSGLPSTWEGEYPVAVAAVAAPEWGQRFTIDRLEAVLSEVGV